ncbi:hypothetical protein [Siccibacter colletis]|uniref:hypothetical protein n=1 Tax=Siccibacter colletis TaxID=1505757 RepID=UPI0004E1ABCC|nr:hypothetical protein [Siccibacter colletis]
MEGPKFKPGPWHWEDKVLCNNSVIVGGDGWTFNDADKRLIQAAPEMFDALRQLRDYVEDVCCVSPEDCDKEHPLMLATSAISKALGK